MIERDAVEMKEEKQILMNNELEAKCAVMERTATEAEIKLSELCSKFQEKTEMLENVKIAMECKSEENQSLLKKIDILNEEVSEIKLSWKEYLMQAKKTYESYSEECAMLRNKNKEEAATFVEQIEKRDIEIDNLQQDKMRERDAVEMKEEKQILMNNELEAKCAVLERTATEAEIKLSESCSKFQEKTEMLENVNIAMECKSEENQSLLKKIDILNEEVSEIKSSWKECQIQAVKACESCNEECAMLRNKNEEEAATLVEQIEKQEIEIDNLQQEQMRERDAVEMKKEKQILMNNELKA